MPAKPGTSRAMRACWADPNWRAKQMRLISRGLNSTAGRSKGNLLYISIGLDPTVLSALRDHSIAEGTSIPELVRTYIQWGLDIDGVTDSE